MMWQGIPPVPPVVKDLSCMVTLVQESSWLLWKRIPPVTGFLLSAGLQYPEHLLPAPTPLVSMAPLLTGISEFSTKSGDYDRTERVGGEDNPLSHSWQREIGGAE